MGNQKDKKPSKGVFATLKSAISPSKKNKNDKRLAEKDESETPEKSSTPSNSNAFLTPTVDKQPSKKQKTNEKKRIVPLEIARLQIGTSLLEGFVAGSPRSACKTHPYSEQNRKVTPHCMPGKRTRRAFTTAERNFDLYRDSYSGNDPSKMQSLVVQSKMDQQAAQSPNKWDSSTTPKPGRRTERSQSVIAASSTGRPRGRPPKKKQSPLRNPIVKLDVMTEDFIENLTMRQSSKGNEESSKDKYQVFTPDGNKTSSSKILEKETGKSSEKLIEKSPPKSFEQIIDKQLSNVPEKTIQKSPSKNANKSPTENVAVKSIFTKNTSSVEKNKSLQTPEKNNDKSMDKTTGKGSSYSPWSNPLDRLKSKSKSPSIDEIKKTPEKSPVSNELFKSQEKRQEKTPQKSPQNTSVKSLVTDSYKGSEIFCEKTSEMSAQKSSAKSPEKVLEVYTMLTEDKYTKEKNQSMESEARNLAQYKGAQMSAKEKSPEKTVNKSFESEQNQFKSGDNNRKEKTPPIETVKNVQNSPLKSTENIWPKNQQLKEKSDKNTSIFDTPIDPAARQPKTLEKMASKKLENYFGSSPDKTTSERRESPKTPQKPSDQKNSKENSPSNQAKNLEKSSSKSPDKLTEKSPSKSPTENLVTKTDEKHQSISSKKISEENPSKSPDKSAQKSPSKSPDKSGQKSPSNSPDNTSTSSIISDSSHVLKYTDNSGSGEPRGIRKNPSRTARPQFSVEHDLITNELIRKTLKGRSSSTQSKIGVSIYSFYAFFVPFFIRPTKTFPTHSKISLIFLGTKSNH